MPYVPPWLDIGPRDYAKAAEAGLSLGLDRSKIAQAAAAANQRAGVELAGIGAQSAAHAASIAEAQSRSQQSFALEQAKLQQDVAMESARLQQQKVLAEMEAKARSEQAQRDFLLKQQQDNVLNAYRQATIGLREKQLKDTATEKAASFADAQGYAKAIAAGTDPAQALSQFPRAATAGLITQISKPKTPPGEPKMSQKDVIDYRAAKAAMAKIGMTLNDPLAMTTKEQKAELQRQYGEAANTVNEITQKLQAPPSTSGTNAPAGGSKRFRIQDGKLVPVEAATSTGTAPAPDEQQDQFLVPPVMQGDQSPDGEEDNAY